MYSRSFLSPPSISILRLGSTALLVMTAVWGVSACKPAPTQPPDAAPGQVPQGAAPGPAASGAEAEAAGVDPTQEPAVAPMTEVTWAQMDHGQKAQYMKHVVTPKMAEIFKAFEPEHYAAFSCMTCHGPGAKDGNFEMPTASLPKLSAGFAEEKANHPKDMDFMVQQVVPEMAKLLHEQPFNPTTQKGFGCFDCHMPKESAG